MPSPYYWENGYFPIQLRDDAVVYIKDIPWDLTLDEAKKLAAVIEAIAEQPEPDEGDSHPMMQRE